ncbi:MAG: nuclear transport factor 2 family protein, partial [Sphingomonadaceae bacterium]|nr:nuclear transport factor 2 family protein [Sphingomonadaceae bacterium]
FIAAFTDPAAHFDPIAIVAPTYVQLGPDAGIVGGETTLTGRDGDGPFSEHIRYADTFHRIGGKWKVVHVQVTMVK